MTWSLDEVARTSDDAVVRRRYDERNFFLLRLLLFFFAFVSFMELVAQPRMRPVEIVVALINGAFVAVMLMLVRDVGRLQKAGTRGNWRAAQWIRNHVSATCLIFAAVQYALVIAFTARSAWVGWAMVMPLLVAGFRMVMAELVLLHAMLAFGAMAMAVADEASVQQFIPPIIANVIALGAELYFTRRMRREVIAEWSERRTQAREQIRMRDELQYARELQLAMLPECAPALGWADLCAISVPATEVGGDYYDYFVDEDRVALVCGDVAGHGMASGLVISSMRSGFTLLRDSLANPAAVLKRLHDLVAETSRRRMLVTVAVVLLDHAARRATIASAGHPPVILARADGSVETIDLYAPPLGVRLPVAIPQRSIDLRTGDIFVLHSDGVYETLNDRGESYGIERLVRVVRECADRDAEALRDAIVADVEAFRGPAAQEDDVTVVVAKVR